MSSGLFSTVTVAGAESIFISVAPLRTSSQLAWGGSLLMAICWVLPSVIVAQPERASRQAARQRRIMAHSIDGSDSMQSPPEVPRLARPRIVPTLECLIDSACARHHYPA